MKIEAESADMLLSRRTRQTMRLVIGFIICLVGLADMLSAIIPRLDWSILLGAWPIVPHRWQAQSFIVVVGFFLIMLSYGLMRGKKHAWRITLALLLLSAVLHVRRGGSILATIVALLLVLALSSLSRFFRARSDPPSAWRGYIALILGLGVVTFYTIGGFIFLFEDFEPLFNRFGIERVVISILTFAHLHGFPYNTRPFIFSRVLPILCLSAVVYGMLQIFRPVVAVFLPCGEEARRNTDRLVRLYGKNSIAYCALDDDKSYFFTKSGSCVISYAVAGSTAVVAGDPIGPPEELAGAIKEFVNFCGEQDWTIVFWQVRDETAQLYRQAGFRLLKIGEDAIIDTRRFTLQGPAMANIRSKARRAERGGLRALFFHGQVDDHDLSFQMEQISQHWLAKKGGTEMGFSQGRLTMFSSIEQLYVLAVDESRRVHAFASFVPIYGRNGWGLNLMRRAAVCTPGTMDLLMTRSIEYLKKRGAEIVSLGLAPMSNLNKEEKTLLESGIDKLTCYFGSPAGGQSLTFYKQKFQPTWESRYLAYSDVLELPRIGWALYQVHQRDATLLGMIRQRLQEWRATRRKRATSVADATAS
ncbi:MAG: DUF2156 domain-containing protein [Ktedonobacteraceae bacterium]|nr:DUF2156 domain-containing protein [Ktedonobacteraceae bacterium]